MGEERGKRGKREPLSPFVFFSFFISFFHFFSSSRFLLGKIGESSSLILSLEWRAQLAMAAQLLVLLRWLTMMNDTRKSKKNNRKIGKKGFGFFQEESSNVMLGSWWLFEKEERSGEKNQNGLRLHILPPVVLWLQWWWVVSYKGKQNHQQKSWIRALILDGEGGKSLFLLNRAGGEEINSSLASISIKNLGWESFSSPSFHGALNLMHHFCAIFWWLGQLSGPGLDQYWLVWTKVL